VSAIEIRRAQRGDEGVIVELLRELADYERLLEKFHLREQDVTRDLFGVAPVMRCDLAFADGESAAIMTWYPTYSTFAVEHGIYVEDLYVRPALRGRGIGRALLVHLAKRAMQEGVKKIEWSVLTWNGPSIEFYENLHAERVDDWYIYRLAGDALAALGEEARQQ
jgi:diamine N-acetyltransferase